MKTLQFKVTTLSSVIIQQTSGTAGPAQTLDFFPGANFMGIVASQVYSREGTNNITYRLFHSGKVRFGDAHPAHNHNRTSRIPLDFYHPKFVEVENECFLHHSIQNFSKVDDLQLKQCRSGFYDLTDIDKVSLVKVEKDLALKSARDSQKRRSLDKGMFCYESIDKGLTYYFEVEVDDESLIETITKALKGEHSIGRSRSAQYGRILIEPATFCSPCSYADNSSGTEIAVYADSRLIFLDEYGIATYQPTVSQLLGIPSECAIDAEIDWSRSQVRSFCYTPRNSWRQCFDTERCGFEKGSVFIVKTRQALAGAKYVGEYCTEGFGHILINPIFLQPQPNANGRAAIQFTTEDSKNTNNETSQITPLGDDATPLLRYLSKQAQAEQAEAEIYHRINNWTDRSKFDSESFASQWGTIRSLAMEGGSAEDLLSKIEDYITHGVAKKKWAKFKRNEILMNFLRETQAEQLQKTIINLASQMAK